MRLICLAIVFGELLLANPVVGQAVPHDLPRRLEGEVVYFTLSWLWPLPGAWALGPEIGGGILEQKTLAPTEDDFTSIAHVGVVSSRRISNSLRVEVGVRFGVAELRSHSCTECLPDGFVAGTAALFTGFERLRFGTRFMSGSVGRETFFAWSPLVVRFEF